MNRLIGPILKTIDSLKKIGSSQEEFSFILGQQWAKAVAIDMVNSAVRALVAALSGTTAAVYDYTGTGTMTHTALSRGKAKLGDQMGKIVCWVMHSKVFADLEVQAIADEVVNVADLVINQGKTSTLGLPVIITDSSPLLVAGTPDEYVTLGLVEGAATITESEERTVVTQLITGLANLCYRTQGEIAYNLGIKGFAYDYGNAGVNPVDASIATYAYWDLKASSYKDGPGVYIYTD